MGSVLDWVAVAELGIAFRICKGLSGFQGMNRCQNPVNLPTHVKTPYWKIWNLYKRSGRFKQRAILTSQFPPIHNAKTLRAQSLRPLTGGMFKQDFR